MSHQKRYEDRFYLCDGNPNMLAQVWKELEAEVENRVSGYDKFAWGMFSGVLLLGILGAIPSTPQTNLLFYVLIGGLVWGHFHFKKTAEKELNEARKNYFDGRDELFKQTLDALYPKYR